MADPLDRPVWSALTGARQAHLALGDARAMRFDPAYALFAAAADDTPQCIEILARLVPAEGVIGLVEAGEADAAEMLALATLTEPGPFFEKTHRLGDFIGVKHMGRLVAMAGERMKPDGFTEVSGVCTHPDWRGRGYAAGLMRAVTARILARGETAFLHAYAANKGAIRLYESLGFSVRTPITFTVLSRQAGSGVVGHGPG